MDLPCQKHAFSLPAASHYINCAYMSPLSRRVEAAGITGVQRKVVPADIRAEDFFTEVDQARDLFARLIGVPETDVGADRVAIIPSVSYGLASVARNTPIGPGQNVVTIARQFPSNVHVWRRVCDESGATFRAVECPVVAPDEVAHVGLAHAGPVHAGLAHSAAWNEALLGAIDADTAAVAVEPVHWTDGTRFDLPAIGERARAVGAAFVVDGTQTVGAEPFDFAGVRPDALVCAAYKWLTGPYSIGAAYFGPRYDDGVPIEESWLTRSGSDDFAELVDQGDEYRPGAIRYDVGETANFVLMPMFVAALEQLLEWGVPDIADYIAGLTDMLFADPRLVSTGLADRRPDTPHLFGLQLPDDADPRAVQARLSERSVFVSVRGRTVRVSPHVYNDAADIDALVEALCATR
ncbi:MAG: aminotransferase class V-fold PLP-dependent enzyme [Gemmatimonadota bacterium]